VTLVTGFLGSGKTTLLNQALSDSAMRSALVIVNEFGEIGLDHALMAQSSDNIWLLENGCLCCTVFGDLLGTLYNLYHKREAGKIADFDRVVIETSGLADPTSIAQAFLSDPALAGLYELGCIITVVDSFNCLETLDRHDASVRQIALADHIVLTKLDLIEDQRKVSARRECVSALLRINTRATIHDHHLLEPTLAPLLQWRRHDPSHGAAEAALWIDEDVDKDHPASKHSDAHASHRDRMQIGSLSFVRDQPLPIAALQLLFDAIERNLGPNLLRVKAIVAVEGMECGPVVIQGAQHLLHNLTWLQQWPFPDRRSRFVIIAAGIGTPELREIIGLLDRVAMRSARARQAGAA
jgi:G3E family GTPase